LIYKCTNKLLPKIDKISSENFIILLLPVILGSRPDYGYAQW